MEDAFGKIVAIIAGVFLLFYLPLLAVTQKMDNTSQGYIDSAVTEFVDNARSTSIINDKAYEELCRKIDAVQDGCNISIVHSSKYATLDGNGNVVISYYSYTKQDILNEIYTPTGANADYRMKNGDFLTVTVYNTKPTLATQLYRMVMPGYNRTGTTIYTNYSGYVGNNPES